ncbi:M20/DapE family protein YgeY/putative selenium metabolism hydrolase [Marinitoga piezophila KA3]|uniref:M20/DapE family protein YgeY/putative selenium metabolism hydrolase n=1 Tax=Marinitoga piezophila (strain DSM 14283 / JCM 11233 / KA3) TaxID=443254 RepID=H2J5F0_MARPK|nr:MULTISPECIES: YgeY family selenium metabolism-linked hydrolase [Marinitoga]AEX86094.1 M20/DapE family protein YgeY/putative selenium metabolism hydrolase [Marinitoga piezophila KA3]
MTTLELAEKYREDIVKFMSKLIKARSYSGDEKEVIQVIKEEMEKVGFDEVKIDGLGNILGRIGSGKTVIAMDAHIDTVEVGNPDLWDKDPFSGDWDEEWVYGRGASDQKAGMCSMVYGMKILKDLNLLDDFTVYVTGTVMEEDCDGLCWRYIVEEDKLKPDFVVITEPTSLNVYRGHRGRIEFRVKTVGLSAHASAPERGDNAIYKMAKIINEIEKLNENLHYDPFLGKGTIVVSQIFFKSPSHNAVPDECVIHIDRRLTAGETKESAFEEIREIFKKTGIDAEIVELTYSKPAYTGVEYPVEKYFPTWVVEEDSTVVQAAKETFEKTFNDEPFIDKWTFSTNGIATAGVYGIPTVGFGPGDEKYAHAPNEKVKIEHLVKAAAFYANFPKTLVEKLKK